jgi:hypothetical protein
MSRKELSGCFLACALAVGCATTEVTTTPTPTRLYTPNEIDHIMAMRADGEGLATVAHTVGGTRTDVRFAERQELARRREARRTPPVILGVNDR